jgi:hypothetical protein
MAKTKKKKTPDVPSIRLDSLAVILYRESTIIAPVDVPLLLNVIYDELGLRAPGQLRRAVARSLRKLGCE